MSYTPTEWKTGDVITADKLNNMESGILNGGSVYPVRMMVVPPEGEGGPSYTLQKAFGEIKNAIEYGSMVVVFVSNSNGPTTTLVSFMFPELIEINSGGGGTVHLSGNIALTAQTDNDYPRS